MEYENLSDLNELAEATDGLSKADMEKLGAVVMLAEPKSAAQIKNLAESLDLFDLAPGAHTPQEYGKYMIQQSGRFEYDENLDAFYDYSLREYCEYYHPIILRYDKKAKVGFQHDCDVFNYGGSKGATYERVVIIPVSTTLPFIERQVKITSNQTQAKFYVACTRAKHSVVFAMENPCENGVFKATDIHFSDKSIPAYKFSKPDSDI